MSDSNKHYWVFILSSVWGVMLGNLFIYGFMGNWVRGFAIGMIAGMLYIPAMYFVGKAHKWV